MKLRDLHAFEQRAKKRDIWVWAWDSDGPDGLAKTRPDSFSDKPGSELWELVTDISWFII